MSGYKGQRGPNVSQYIANLNQLSPQSENLTDPLPADDDFSAFLNNDFFDVNAPVNFDASLDLDVDLPAESPASPDFENSSRKHSTSTAVEPTMDFTLNGDFPFTDFGNNFGPNPILDPAMQGVPQPQPTHYQIPHAFASPTSALSPTAGYDQATKKRRLDSVVPVHQQQPPLLDPVTNAADEDKRRRNTAASARFRVKKKQREATLEKTAKDMSEKATRLEQKVQQLETENAWLKSLITEKSGNPTNDLKKLLSKHQETVAGRSSTTHTDGVGTDA